MQCVGGGTALLHQPPDGHARQGQRRACRVAVTSDDPGRLWPSSLSPIAELLCSQRVLIYHDWNLISDQDSPPFVLPVKAKAMARHEVVSMATISAGKAMANRSNTSIVGFSSPRSRRLTPELSMPVSTTRLSCDKPNRTRRRRRFRATSKPDRLARSTADLLEVEADPSRRGIGLLVSSMGASASTLGTQTPN
jgi:hypothetical protein